MASKTESFKWGAISGKHFGYEINIDDPNTKLQGEYKFYYNMNETAQKKSFHVLIYNKEGVYIPAMQGLLTRFQKSYLGAGFAKSASFFLLVVCYFWLSKTCVHYSGRTDIKYDEMNLSTIIGTACEYKSSVFFTMAVVFVIVFVVGNVFKQIGNLRQKRQRITATAPAAKKKH